MVNSPMDIDMETSRKSFVPSGRKSRGRSRQVSYAPGSVAPKTPKTQLKEEIGTQTRRIVKVRRNFAEVDLPHKSSSPPVPATKRKLFGSPSDEPLSPGYDGARNKIRRIAESPLLPRKSSIAPAGRKSKSKRISGRQSGRPSAAPVTRRSTISTASSGVNGTLETMTVRQLKNLLTSAGVDTTDCIEKQELVEKASRLGLSSTVGRASVSAKSTPSIEAAPIPAPTLGNGGRSSKRHSRKQSNGKVSTAAMTEIVRIEEVVTKHNATPFDILGMSRMGATDSSIKSRSKQLFRHVHPDKIHDDAIKQRAHNVFQLINQAVDDALKLISTTVAKDPPKPAMGIKYTIERAGTVVLLRWKPDKSAEGFRVLAQLPGGYRSSVDQGTVTNMTGDNGELEYAISAQSRAGNDEMFSRGKFEVSITAFNSAGDSPCMTINIDLNRPGSTGGGLKRHHTIC